MLFTKLHALLEEHRYAFDFYIRVEINLNSELILSADNSRIRSLLCADMNCESVTDDLRTRY